MQMYAVYTSVYWPVWPSWFYYAIWLYDYDKDK